MQYIFDIDMTLSFLDRKMTDDMASIFRRAMANKEYYFCSGATLEKVKWRLPKDIYDNAAGVFPVMGGEFWKKGELVYRKEFTAPQALLDDLTCILKESNCPEKLGDHIEDRKTMVCFSTVGCFAKKRDREAYYTWEEQNKEREAFVQSLADKYTDLCFMIGGKTSIDIAPKGSDKGQILTELRALGVIDDFSFFGDKMEPGGIDYPLGQALEKERLAHTYSNKVYAVTDPSVTYDLLEKMAENDSEK
jgi:phosphomannomutase